MRMIDQLRLVQWLSPAFPIGAFAYSHGLEVAIAAREVHDADYLQDWIFAVLSHGLGRTDAILLAHTRNGCDVTDYALAFAASAERVTEMMEQGRAFGMAIAAITGRGQPVLPYALAVGHATRSLNVETAEMLLHWLQGLSAQLVSVGVRFVPLGQTQGQTVLARLGPLITELASRYAVDPLSDVGTATFRADLAAMQHETLEVRIFRS